VVHHAGARRHAVQGRIDGRIGKGRITGDGSARPYSGPAQIEAISRTVASGDDPKARWRDIPIPHQQHEIGAVDNCSSVQGPMGDRKFLQGFETKPANQKFSEYIAERGINANLDSGHRHVAGAVFAGESALQLVVLEPDVLLADESVCLSRFMGMAAQSVHPSGRAQSADATGSDMELIWTGRDEGEYRCRFEQS
jgi:hypothetical protein